ncbi:hypothetical protein NP590_00745 [Methylomonas sp. SURF-2]|uniref:Uncharacterized protein n=1 Tax=Methylomonas subterranea TaxID=2952225 RepID=A0ABT1TAX5_9GAMM|nr:hypothetical protein [Methylomonas sp. SURF-2]MCQ8102614.1 hypothetical protein [Methylomonas sp. SURF-2]
MTEPRLMLAGQDITECCKKIIPGQTEDLLLSQLQGLIADYPIQLALAGEEWYRLGGVVDMDGQRIANDLIEWAERTYLECGQNLQTLIDYTVEQKLIATKQTGKTLYFVVQTGDRAEDFTLIEIDKTHEVTDRMLVNPLQPPEDLEEFIDPLQPFCIESYGFGHSRYTYRRKTDVKLFMDVINERHRGEHPVQRFMDDWNRSSAGQKKRLSDEWIIRPYQHTGRFGEQIVNVDIINTQQYILPHLEDFSGKKGNALSSLLNRFDRQAGYPFAWFFYMLKGKQVSTHCAEAVYRDIAGDFAYLGQRDEAVLRDWIASPYNV